MPAVPTPAGFPRCGTCPLRHLERPRTCLACAVPGPPPTPAPPSRPCAACGQGRRPGGRCPTPACGAPGRPWSVVWSVGLHEGALRAVLVEHKYGPDGRWAPVLARLLVGWLDAHATWVEDLDVVVPVPAWRGPGARRRDPLGEVVAAVAALAGDRWEVLDAVAKRAEVPAMVGRGAAGRRAVAEGSLRRSLVVADPAAVAGARVLVLDDVLTGGGTLTEVARALRGAGAAEVAGLVLTRPAWRWRRGRPSGPPGRGAP